MKLRYLLAAMLLACSPAYAGIESWSTTAASNNSSPPNGAPEGMAPSAVNNVIRENMAGVRTWYEDAGFVNLGYTHTYASGTSFTIASTDYTSTYEVGRRIRAVGSSTGTIYGTITASSFSTDTTVTVEWDSGSLSNESLTVSLGVLTPTGDTIPYLYKEAAAVASASTVDLDAINGDFTHITGTTTITAFTLAQGQRRLVVFDGALTLTHNGTSLILPGGENIATAAGDVAIIVGEGSGNVRVANYLRANGTAIGGAQYKVGNTTFDLTSSTGTFSITGVGFKPKALILIATVSSTTYASWGFTDGTTSLTMRSNASGTPDNFAVTANLALLEATVGNNQVIDLSSFDSDGATFANTKSGSPTGTASILYIAFR